MKFFGPFLKFAVVFSALWAATVFLWAGLMYLNARSDIGVTKFVKYEQTSRFIRIYYGDRSKSTKEIVDVEFLAIEVTVTILSPILLAYILGRLADARMRRKETKIPAADGSL
ncbi:MAG: hypothetical protein NT123_19535 [Proteobacteria bacterium]|nr:hypothetical protein [Pseudomonadota bacterium]